MFTAEDGWVWTFVAVDHWTAECVAWHVCKVGSRFAALDPIAQGLGRRYGSVEADVARGLALRMDHGSQYLSDHFLNQVSYWGIHPSFGFLEEPETNGVVERWNRTLKEQAVYGRVFRNLAEVRAAVAAFVERYNQCWRLEKLAYRTPLEAREQYELRHARSVNVCPRNQVRYTIQLHDCVQPIPKAWTSSKTSTPFKVAVVSQKGGVGKSSIARLIAREFAANGWRVTIADMASRGRSAQRLLQLRQRPIRLLADKDRQPGELGLQHRRPPARLLPRRGAPYPLSPPAGGAAYKPS